MNKFEKYLEALDKKQKIMIYLSVVFVAIMILNQILPSLSETQENLQSSISTMQMEILNNSSKKLKRDLDKTQELVVKNEEILDTQKQRVNHLMSQLYKVKFAFFREAELARSLDALLKESVKKDVKINSIKNTDEKIASLSELVHYKKSMSIEGESSYANILEFINYIENLDLLLSIKEVKLEELKEKSGVYFTLQINFFGVGL